MARMMRFRLMHNRREHAAQEETRDEGELIFKGPRAMKGSWNRPDATTDIIRNGRLYAGDIAVT